MPDTQRTVCTELCPACVHSAILRLKDEDWAAVRWLRAEAVLAWSHLMGLIAEACAQRRAAVIDQEETP